MDEKDKLAIASDYANSIKCLEECIDRQREEIARKRAQLDGLKAVTYGDKVSAGGEGRLIEELGIQITGLIREYVTDLAEYIERYKEARDCFSCLQHPYSSALIWHYMMLRSWREVEAKLHYSHSYMMEIRRDALIALYDVMPIHYKKHRSW